MRAYLPLLLLLGGCSLYYDFKGASQPCDSNGGCNDGFHCQLNRCVRGAATGCRMDSDCSGYGLCLSDVCHYDPVAVAVAADGGLIALAPDLSCNDGGSQGPTVYVQGCIEDPSALSQGSTASATLSFYQPNAGQPGAGLGTLLRSAVIDTTPAGCRNTAHYTVSPAAIPTEVPVRAHYSPIVSGGPFKTTVTDNVRLPRGTTSVTLPVSAVSSSFFQSVLARGNNAGADATLVLAYIRDCQGRPVANAQFEVTKSIDGGGASYLQYPPGTGPLGVAAAVDGGRPSTGATGVALAAGIPSGSVQVAAFAGDTLIGSWELYLPSDTAAVVTLRP